MTPQSAAARSTGPVAEVPALRLVVTEPEVELTEQHDLVLDAVTRALAPLVTAGNLTSAQAQRVVDDTVTAFTPASTLHDLVGELARVDGADSLLRRVPTNLVNPKTRAALVWAQKQLEIALAASATQPPAGRVEWACQQEPGIVTPPTSERNARDMAEARRARGWLPVTRRVGPWVHPSEFHAVLPAA